MRVGKPGRTVSWVVLLVITAILGVNGCGELGNNTAPNDTPVANAGRDQGSIRPGTLITLNGSASSDPDGQPLTYSWSFVSRPAGSVAVLTNPTRVSPTFMPDLVGDYVVRLIVNDGTVNSAPDTVLITSNNVPPVANAGPNQRGFAPGTLVTLNGALSFDGDRDPLTFNWSFVSRPPGSTAVLTDSTTVTPTFTVDRAGDYEVQLIVNDGIVNSAPDSVIITTNNVAPVANAGPDQGGKTPGALVTLNGSASSDANGDPLTYSWSFVSRPAGSTAVLANPTSVNPTFTVDLVTDDYVVQLIVRDGTLNSAAASVTISPGNVAPVANAGPDQTVGPGLVTLNGGGSSDANGDPLTYQWSLSRPAGSAAVLSSTTSVSPTFTVDLAGDYVAQLIVNDGTVNSAPDTVEITTNNVAPVANAGPDQGGIAPGTVVTLNGSGSFDANGDPLTYSWSLSPPAGSAAVLSSTTSESPTFTVDRAGDYVAQLIVNDGTVNSAPDSVVITRINAAPEANAGPDQGGQPLLSLITLDGSGSSDANGDSITYSWTITDKPPLSTAVLLNPTDVSPTFILDLPGDYVVELIVNDGTLSSPSDSVTITAN